MAELRMPSLGADMEAGTLVAYRKAVGDLVARGEILAEVETDKGVIEVECFVAGRLEQLLVTPGSKVPVGTPLAVIEPVSPGAPEATMVQAEQPATLVPTSPPQPPQAPHSTPAARKLMRERGLSADHIEGHGRHGTITRADVLSSAPPPAALPPHPSAGSRIAASPRARRLAQALGVKLGSLVGSGPGGYVVSSDVEAASRERPSAAPHDDAAARIRRSIAEAMARSKREIPHYYLTQTVDLSGPLSWLTTYNEMRGVEQRILPAVLYVRAVARAVRKVSGLNGHYRDGQLLEAEQVHVGVAVSLRGGGLLAPAIMNADRLSLDELTSAFSDLINRARTGRLRSSEMASGTICITNLGERGVESVLPVILPPQVAMVGFGAIHDAALVVGGSVVARPAVTITLAADHRVSDGHRGALFLRAIASDLQECTK